MDKQRGQVDNYLSINVRYKVRKEVAHSKLLRLVEMFVKSYDELKTCDVVTFIKLIMTFYSRILNVDNENSSP